MFECVSLFLGPPPKKKGGKKKQVSVWFPFKTSAKEGSLGHLICRVWTSLRWDLCRGCAFGTSLAVWATHFGGLYSRYVLCIRGICIRGLCEVPSPTCVADEVFFLGTCQTPREGGCVEHICSRSCFWLSYFWAYGGRKHESGLCACV